MVLLLFLLTDAATSPLRCLYSVSGFRGVILGGVWAVLFFSFAIAFSLFLLVKIKFYSK